MEKVLVEILTLVYSFLLELLSNPLIVAPLVLWLLSYVPGPFKTLATALIQVLLEQARKLLEDRKERATQDAVALAEQLGKTHDLTNEEKKITAVSHVLKRVPVTSSEASDLIEAEVKRTKNFQF